MVVTIKRAFRAFFVAFVWGAICGSAFGAPFTPGNLVVYRIGDGSAALASTATAVFLDEYTPAGALVQSVPMPTVVNGANKRLTASGTATSDGLLTRSADGRYLVATGYEAAIGTASITTAASTTVNRTVARIAADSSVDTSTALTDASSGGNFRGATSADGTAFWTTGSAGGLRYASLGATSSIQISATVLNLRAVSIFGGQLYISDSSGTAVRLGAVGSGLPTIAGQTITNIPGFPASTGSPYQFFFADLDAGTPGLDTLYVADDTANTITKYSLVAGNWTPNGAVASTTVRGLTGVVNGSVVTLYATQQTGIATVVTITDSSGYNGSFSGTPSTVATAGTNKTFRGVALAPEVPVTVTPSAGPNGTISPNTPLATFLGQVASFTVTPDPGYSAIVTGTCGGTLMGNTYVTSVLSTDCTVVASFNSTPTFTVTPSATAGGSITPNTPQTILQGNTTSFTVTPSPGYDVAVGGTCGGTLMGNTYNTNAIVADCGVDATFTLQTFTVTPSAGMNGTISPAMAQTVGYGATAVFTVTPDAGYLASVMSTCGGTLAGTTYTTGPVTANCSVAATFAPLPVYTVMAAASANGSITPSTQMVVSGNTTSFTVTPSPGYSVAMRGTCGGTLNGTVYTTNPITQDCTVTATFAKKVVLFLGNSFTFGRVDPVMSYNTANVTDLTYAMWVANPTGTNIDEPHPWGGIPGVFKKLTDQAGLEYDVSISARNAASLRGHYLNSNPAGWDLRGNAASQRWDAIVLQDLSDEPLPAGRSPNANLPYFNAYADKFLSWVRVGAAEAYTESFLFGGGSAATCAAVTGASQSSCDTVRTISPANANASPNTDVYLYQTWARPDLIAPNGTNASGTTYSAAEGLEAMTADFHNAYFGRAAANPSYKAVNPVGDAFLRAVTSGVAMRDPYAPEAGKINLWHTDFFHPSKYGSYLSALVHFAMISGISPTTLGAMELAANDLGISPTDAVALQQVARDTVVPAAPAIGTATGGDSQVTVSFTPQANIGRLPITGYTATCGMQSASGMASPIVVTGLSNGNAVTCTVAASNSVGLGAPSAASNSVTPSVAVIISSAAPTGGTVGVPYMFNVVASGSPAPTYSVSSGALPGGLTLNGSNGLISGTPTAAGTFTGTLQASNGVSTDVQNFSITIAQGTQSINFAALPGKALGDAPFTVSATASSGLTVSFTSLTGSVCTATGTNGATITLLAAGTCTIAADQAGDANYSAAAQVTRNFTVAFSSTANVVISQVYGGGGNTGSTFKNDFIELFNRSVTPVNITGWSVQYASSAGTTWQVTTLSGTIPAGGYYLVQQAAGTGGTTNLPLPDATGTIAMAAAAGKVALTSSVTALTGSCPTANVVDFVGFGSAANCFEGSGPTPAPSASASVIRAGNGCTDTNNNAADFSAGTVFPRNSTSTPNSCSPLPNLSINDVSANEGDAGTTAFTFTVSLSSPAGAGGVSFDIATQDGTATAGSDYVAQSLPMQTIPQGMSSYTFTVLVNGDTAPEGNETFNVNVTNVTGANVVKGQGVGTVVNDDAGVNLSINDVSQNEGDSGTTTFTFTVSLSGPAPAGGVTFDIATAPNTAIAPSDFTAKALPMQVIPEGATSYIFDVLVNGDTTFEQNETFFVNVTNVANAISVKTQGVGTIVNDDAIRIHDVQGSGTASPLVGQVVTVEGIVTANYQGTGTLLGYFIQEPDNLADADPATSEGVFVFTNATPASVNIGDLVRVTGTVSEFGTAPNTLTEIGTPTLTPTTTVLSSGNVLPAFVTINLPVATAGDLERYEGMRVRLQQTLTVSDHFDLAHFGEITVTANGRAIQPTSVVDPNDNPASGNSSSGSSNVPAVNAYLDLTRRSSIILDGSFQAYPATVPFLDPATNTIRLGSTVADVTGVLSQLGGTHRIYPDVAPVFTYAPRPAAPPNVGGNVKVASANVLNYFNGDGMGGGFPTSRGANSLVEFNRQRGKVIAALSGLNADVIGLLEVENDGNSATSAIQDIVNGMNAASAPGTWSFVADPAQYNGSNPGTSDLIHPTIIYKTAVVAPDGASIAYIDSAFSNARAPVAQAFRVLANNEKFTLVVNHFKSKGSGGTGADADQGDGQAFYNDTRKREAAALLSFIATLTPTTPRIIAMGDFNAYEEEDPLDILRAGGMTTLISNDSSYMFDGLSGSLDHALANPAMLSVVAGAGHWHINADEPVFLDYNVENKNNPACVTAPCTTPDYYTGEPYRASDHDPVLVGLNLVAAQTISFGALGNKVLGDAPFTVSATASSSLAVTFTSLTTMVCTVSGATVTILTVGTCTIAADQAGNLYFTAAPQVTRSFTVALPSYVVTPSAGANGTISPNTPQTVTPGATTIFTVTPDSGYLAAVSGSCGGALVGTTYTTNAIVADCTVSASFSLQPTLPGAPVIGTATAGDGQAGISFTPPMSDGGSGITSYTATCTNGGSFSASGPASPLTVTGLTNGTSYACSVTATNGIGTGPASATVNVTPNAALAVTAVFSRKAHGSQGVFDLPLSQAAAVPGGLAVEPRAMGAGHVIVFRFNGAVTNSGTASAVDGNSVAVGAVAATAGSNEVEVTLTGLNDAQRVTITLTGVMASNGSASATAAVGFLQGDVNFTRSVGATDITAVKARSGQVVDSGNFWYDVNLSGYVSASDIATVKARSTATLP